MRRPITTVLFDFAGTLFAPRPAPAWVGAAAAELGVELAPGQLETLAAEYLRVGLPGAPYPATVPPELADAYARRDLDGASHRRAYVGLLATVDAPAAGLAEALYEQVLRPGTWLPYRDAQAAVGALADTGTRVGLISNVGFDLRPILRHHGFAALAEHCTLSFEHGVVKPDPAIFEAALADLGAAPEETLMVGDNPVADAAATTIGCRTVLLPMSLPGAEHGLDVVTALVSAREPLGSLAGR